VWPLERDGAVVEHGRDEHLKDERYLTSVAGKQRERCRKTTTGASTTNRQSAGVDSQLSSMAWSQRSTA
jgi:hypothetical protein